MSRPSRRKPANESQLGVKLLRSAQQARDWVKGTPAARELPMWAYRKSTSEAFGPKWG
jgi:hypothetical protein